VNLENLAIQVNQGNKEIKDTLVGQESLAHRDHQEKMVLMEAKMTVQSVVHTIHKKEIMVIQGRMENEEFPDQEGQMDHVEMMPSVTLEDVENLGNQEEMDDLEMMVHLESLAMMVVLVKKLA